MGRLTRDGREQAEEDAQEEHSADVKVDFQQCSSYSGRRGRKPARSRISVGPSREAAEARTYNEEDKQRMEGD